MPPLLCSTGWRLALAFDSNPNIDIYEYVLNIDSSENRPNLKTVLITAALYVLRRKRIHNSKPVHQHTALHIF